ncbi:MAG: hypothetical protein ACD_81C00131G0002 [uncultured bacterium]|uniref:N-acetyltransferase domain-containing protein n=2 Tax=Candidatus Wolfeibacteriota TaxID=1752735 RepID=A0A0G1H800_9BACT|nr:MAG: hypothetical protein ACD_81C00131G0002 [uncultured bacterium]KKR12118.1 MAG: hypothetical protein UT41_C0003G0045 [Candidatus Wolfebacteria bacterium GW2011_GWC2_39_22]KKT42940.1 MAG: hypothetical protein UW32_C0003G0043 [Candidatus Wolfebacteria bacterium GW2011_GWE2_44_13]HBI25261.1 hypothetical protein [Candidatus Wolfebacteria bacterium]
MNEIIKEKYIEEVLKVGGEFFAQFNDPTEIKATRENYEKISSLHPSAYKFAVNEQGELIAWTVVIPTSKELANDFIERRITEQELLDKTEYSNTHDALYLFAAFTKPEYRGKGYVKKMTIAQVMEITENKPKETLVFAWTVSKEGEAAIVSVARDLGVVIKKRRKKEEAGRAEE